MPPAVAISLAISAGGMALQYLLTPKIKPQKTDKGKMDDIRIQGSDYGTIIPKVWGKARLAGNVVFSSGIDHYTVTTGGNTGGGKKGGGASETEHIYKTSLGVLVCQGELATFDRIWGDADLIINNLSAATGYFEAEDATLSGGASSFVDATASGGDAVQNIGSGGQVVFNTSSVSAPALPRLDPDETALAKTKLTFYYKSATDKQAVIDTEDTSPATHDFAASPSDWTAYEVIVDGFANTVTYNNAGGPAPNLDRIRVEKEWEIVGQENVAFQVSGVVDPDIGYPTNLDNPGPYYNYPPASVKNGTTETYTLTTPIPGEVIRFYTGTEIQTADSKIKSWLDTRYGAGEGDLRASAMRGLAYVLFQDRTLKSARVENFTFEVDTDDATVNTILTDLFTAAGLSASDYTITATAGLTQEGFLDHTKQSRKTLVEHLERYHFFRIGEIDGEIKTILDTFTSSATVSENSLRAHAAGEDMPGFDAEVVVKDERELPREVRVSVMQPNLEYHNETVAAHLFTVQGKETKDYGFPIVDSAVNARTVAEKLLLKEHAESSAYEFWGMPEMAVYSVGDVITVPINDVDYKMRIEKKQMTLPIGKIRFQCVAINPFAPSYYVDDVTATLPMAAVQFVAEQFPRNSIAFVIPSKPIRGEDKGKLGVYLALCGRGYGQGDTISLYREMDEDNYVLQSVHDTPVPLGLCEDTLGNWAGGTATEDTSNILDIWFFDDVTLETVLQADIDRHPHVNLIRIGDEWLQFRTATIQTLEDNSPYRSKWRITNLWRGKYGTSAEISAHAADEYAAIVTPQLVFFELDAADVGEVVNIKAVTNRQGVEVAPISSFTFTPAASEYTVTNGTTDRAFNANSTSIDELADVLATVIDDLNL